MRSSSLLIFTIRLQVFFAVLCVLSMILALVLLVPSANMQGYVIGIVIAVAYAALCAFTLRALQKSGAGYPRIPLCIIALVSFWIAIKNIIQFPELLNAASTMSQVSSVCLIWYTTLTGLIALSGLRGGARDSAAVRGANAERQ